MIPTIAATKVYKAVSPIIEKNMTIDLLTDEEIMLTSKQSWKKCQPYTKKTLLTLYHEATDEPYTLLYINLMQRDRKRMFMQSSQKYAIPSQNICHIYNDNLYKPRRTCNNPY